MFNFVVLMSKNCLVVGSFPFEILLFTTGFNLIEQLLLFIRIILDLEYYYLEDQLFLIFRLVIVTTTGMGSMSRSNSFLTSIIELIMIFQIRFVSLDIRFYSTLFFASCCRICRVRGSEERLFWEVSSSVS